MKTASTLVALIVLWVSASAAAGESTFSSNGVTCTGVASPVWESDPLLNPESIVYYADENLLYVSNQNFSGEGSISKLSISGKMVTDHWVKGLKEPKGMIRAGKDLYVADVDRLKIIDIKTGSITASIAGDDKVAFLNDVDLSKDGEIYVTEMFNSAIYTLSHGGKRLDRLVISPDLENPNGILVEQDRIVLSSWGRFSDDNPMAAADGHLNFLDPISMSVTKGSNTPIGHMDGLQRFPATGGYIMSDYIGGNVYHVDISGTVEIVIHTPPNAGDILLLEDINLIIVPLNEKIVGYSLSCE